MLSHLKEKSFHYPSYLFFAVLCRTLSLVSNSEDFAREIWFRFLPGFKSNTTLSETGKCQKVIKMFVYVWYSRFQTRNRYFARIRLALCWCTQWRRMYWTSSCFRISAGLAVTLTLPLSVQANARIVTWKLSWPFLTNSYHLTVHDLVIFNFHNVCSKSSDINYPGIHKRIFFKFYQVNCCC